MGKLSNNLMKKREKKSWFMSNARGFPTDGIFSFPRSSFSLGTEVFPADSIRHIAQQKNKKLLLFVSNNKKRPGRKCLPKSILTMLHLCPKLLTRLTSDVPIDYTVLILKTDNVVSSFFCLNVVIWKWHSDVCVKHFPSRVNPLAIDCWDIGAVARKTTRFYRGIGLLKYLIPTLVYKRAQAFQFYFRFLQDSKASAEIFGTREQLFHCILSITFFFLFSSDPLKRSWELNLIKENDIWSSELIWRQEDWIWKKNQGCRFKKKTKMEEFVLVE